MSTATLTQKRIVEQANDAFGRADTAAFLELCTEDVEWTMAGDRTVRGKTAIREWMRSMDPGRPEIAVDDVVAEGDFVVTSGKVTMKDKEGRPATFDFCDVYRFQGNRIASLKAFMVKTDRSS